MTHSQKTEIIELEVFTDQLLGYLIVQAEDLAIFSKSYIEDSIYFYYFVSLIFIQEKYILIQVQELLMLQVYLVSTYFLTTFKEGKNPQFKHHFKKGESELF